jgi:hypothetical protein
MRPIKKLNLWPYSYFLIILLTFGCTSDKKEKTPGVDIQFIGAKALKNVKPGQVIVFNMLFRNDEGKVITDTQLMDELVVIKYNDSIWDKSGLFYQALKRMGEGDSAIFTIPAANFYNKAGQELPKILEEGDSLTFQLKVLELK